MPLSRQPSNPQRRGRNATRASGGASNGRALAASPRPPFRPSGITKPVTLSPSPSPSPSPPRTRKQSLERREALLQPTSSPRAPRQQRGRGAAVPSSPPTKHGGGDGGGGYRVPAASPPQRAPCEQQHAPPPCRSKPQRHPQQQRHPRPSRQDLAPERDQARRGGGGGGSGVWDDGRGDKQRPDTGEAGGRMPVAEDERGAAGGSGRRESYPYGAVYSKSFDTGEFFSGVGDSTPVASPVNSQRRRRESGDSSSSRRDGRHHNSQASSSGRVGEPSSRSRGRGGGEAPVPRGSASTTFNASPRAQGSGQPQVSGHPGRWFSSYADSHAAATRTAATDGGESWDDGGRRVNPTPRRRSGAAVVAGSGGTRGRTGDSYSGS